MNSLPFELKQFIFWHMHPIKEQKQLTAIIHRESPYWVIEICCQGFSGDVKFNLRLLADFLPIFPFFFLFLFDK